MNSIANMDPLAQVLRYWKIVPRYRWWIFLCTVALSLAGISYIAMMRDYYQATTTVLVDPQKIPERYVSSTVVADPAQRLATISQEVLSSTRLEEMIDKYGLYPELRNLPREDSIAQMRSDVKIEVKQGYGSIGSFSITYTSTNRGIAALVANELAGGFVAWNVESREQQVTGTTEFLKSELERARERLQEQESKLAQFRLQHAGEMPDQQPANLQMLSHLQSQFEANRESLSRLEVERKLASRASENNPAVASSSETPSGERAQLETEKRDLERRLSDLGKRYTPVHPDIVAVTKRLKEVRALLRDLPAPVPEQVTASSSSTADPQIARINSEIKRLTEEQRQIQAKIKVYQARIEAAPAREQQMTDLTRNYQVSNTNYSSLLDKTYSSELAAQLEKRQKGERFNVLDAAREPERPFKPKRKMLMVMAVLGSLFFSLATVIAKELLSSTVKNEEELTAFLKGVSPPLISIPVIPNPALQRRRRLWAGAGLTLAVLACVAEVILWLKLKPIL